MSRWCLLLVLVVALALMHKAAGSDVTSKNDDDVTTQISISSAPASSPSLPLPELVRRLTNETFDAYVRDRSRISVVLFYATWQSKSVLLLDVLERVAERFRSAQEMEAPGVDVQFAALHGPHYKKFCRSIGVTTFPLLQVVVRGLHHAPYTFTVGPHNHLSDEDAVYDFIRWIVKTDKRQAAAEAARVEKEKTAVVQIRNPQAGKVHELTPETFAKYRNASNLLLFVLFYAPWCGGCKGPQESLVGVAEYFKADTSVMIAKVDCDQHSLFCVESMNIEGYPTFVTYAKPSFAKEGTVYHNGHDTVDITQHLDTQNMYFDHEGLNDMRAQFEKVRGMKKEDLPEDLSELGGVFAHFPTRKKKDKDEKPVPIGQKRRR